MNYGYHGPSSAALQLLPADLDNRYPIYLYHRVVDGLDLTGKDVLEIGCGRGGGAAALFRYQRPRRLTGVDISYGAIELCRRLHRAEGLDFVQGDAEAVPFPAQSFDVIVNVESSFCYGSMERFLGEVRRLLRPGGHFLFADIRLTEEMPELRRALSGSGLELVREDDITANVAAALHLDSARRRSASRRALPWPAQQWFDVFLGIEGTRIPNGLEARRMVYICCKFRNPGAAAAEAPPDPGIPLAASLPADRSFRRHAGE